MLEVWPIEERCVVELYKLLLLWLESPVYMYHSWVASEVLLMVAWIMALWSQGFDGVPRWGSWLLGPGECVRVGMRMDAGDRPRTLTEFMWIQSVWGKRWEWGESLKPRLLSGTTVVFVYPTIMTTSTTTITVIGKGSSMVHGQAAVPVLAPGAREQSPWLPRSPWSLDDTVLLSLVAHLFLHGDLNELKVHVRLHERGEYIQWLKNPGMYLEFLVGAVDHLNGEGPIVDWLLDVGECNNNVLELPTCVNQLTNLTNANLYNTKVW